LPIAARYFVQTTPRASSSRRKLRSATSVRSRSRGTLARASSTRFLVKAVLGLPDSAPGNTPLCNSITYHCSSGGSVWLCCFCSAGLLSSASGIFALPGGGHEYVGADEQNNRREIRRQERHKNSLGEPNRGGLLVITGRRQRSSAPVTCPSQPCSNTTLLLSDTCVPLLAVPTAGSSGPQIFSYEKTCGRLAHSRGLARAPTGAT